MSHIDRSSVDAKVLIQIFDFSLVVCKGVGCQFVYVNVSVCS